MSFAASALHVEDSSNTGVDHGRMNSLHPVMNYGYAFFSLIPVFLTCLASATKHLIFISRVAKFPSRLSKIRFST